MDIMKNNHFVSQFYLKAWSKCGEKVFTTINNSTVRPMAINKIASSNFLYRIKTINTETQRALLNQLGKQNLGIMGDLLESIINNIVNIDSFKNAFGVNVITEKEILLKSNAIEMVYTIVEDLAAPLMQKIINDEIHDFNINDYQNILRYTVYQLTRTQKVKKLSTKKIEPLLKTQNYDESYYLIFSLIASEQIILKCINEFFTMIVLDNQTSVNFITNDNPVFNLHTIESKKTKLYLPISPKKAIFFETLNIDEKSATILKKNILENKQYDKYFLDSRLILEEEVLSLNQKIKENSDIFVFALEENDIY